MNFYDFWELDLSSVTLPEGTEIEIEAISDDTIYLDPTIMVTNLTDPTFGACGSTAYRRSFPIPVCTVISGAVLQITITRSDPNQEYTLLAHPKVPTIIPIYDSKSYYYTALGGTSTIYFEYYPKDTNADAAVEFVVDNVYGGAIIAQASNIYLPYETSCALTKDCGDPINGFTIGCHVRFEPCSQEFSARSDTPLYIYVRVLYFNDPSVPVTFTVTAEEVSKPPKEISLSSTSPLDFYGDLRKRSSQQYYITRANIPGWLTVTAFLDARLNDFPVPEAWIYINAGSPAGPSETCYNNIYSCQLTNSLVSSEKSCAIQLDPCQLDSMGSIIYIAVYAEDTPNVYYYQDETMFTLHIEAMNPDANLISLGKIESSVLYGTPIFPTYKIFKLDAFPDTYSMSITVSSNNRGGDLQGPTLRVELLYASYLTGPRCSCWNPDRTFTVAFNDDSSVTLDSCELFNKDGVYIAVSYSKIDARQYYYQQEFSISVAKEDSTLITYQSNLLTLGQAITDSIENGGDSDYYDLSIDASTLSSNTYKLTLLGHVQDGFSLQVFSYINDLTYYVCNGPPDNQFLSSCDADDTVDGECTILLRPCDFPSGAGNLRFLVTVDRGTNAGEASRGIYDLEFSTLNAGVYPTGTSYESVEYLTTGIYNHYSVSVTQTDVNNNNQLFIQAYTDASLAKLDGANGLQLFVNSPNLPQPAGISPDCLCNELSDFDGYEVQIIIPHCQLIAGDYYFSLKTTSQAYEDVNIPIHVKVSLVPVELSWEGFNTAQDYALYPEMSGIIPFQLDESFFDASSTQKSVQIRVYTTTTDESITIQASSQDPSTCDCFTAEFISTGRLDNDRYTAVIDLDYCKVNNIYTWYLAVSTISYTGYRRPIEFTVEFDNQNIPDTISSIAVTKTACGGSPTRYESVYGTNYRYYEISFPSDLTGDELVDITVVNVTGGYVSLYVNSDDLPTRTCSNYTNFIANQLSIPCSNQVGYLAVYGTALDLEKPVTYLLTVCLTPTTSIDFTNSKSGVLAFGETSKYVASLASVNDGDVVFRQSELTKYLQLYSSFWTI